jgi:hypothetical protein
VQIAHRLHRADTRPSEAVREFGERGIETVMQRHVGSEFVVAAAEILHECVRAPAAIVRADRIRLSPRIGRSLALNRA